MSEADGATALREFALTAMALEDASASIDEEELVATVTYAAYSEGEISVAPILDEARECDLEIVDVIGDFDAGTVRVEVRPA